MTEAPGEPRVLLVGLGWAPDQTGGLNRYVRDLLATLPSARALLVGSASDAPESVTAVSSHEHPVARRLWAISAAARRLAGSVDVVDVHFALYGAPPVLLGALRRLPVVVHFHGPWADEAVAERHAGPAGRLARRAIERALYRRATRVVVLSGAFARLLVERYRVSPWRISIVAPGVDLVHFGPGDRAAARATFGVADDAWVAVSPRRLVPRTGVDVLVAAWSSLSTAARAVGLTPELLVAGDGPERRVLEALAARADAGLSVRLLGEVSEDALVDLYRAADVCVVPSRALEGFGLVVLESLACGTPVVVTDVGGLPESVAGLGDELVVPAEDAASLRARLWDAMTGTRPLPTAERCRAHAERFGWARAAERHRALYREAVRPPAVRAPRVVYVDHCARLSGGELALVRLLGSLDGVDAHVVLFEDGPLTTRLGAAGITAEVLPMDESARALPRSRVGRRMPASVVMAGAVQVVRLARRLRALRPDVVHANSLKAGVVTGLACRLVPVPFVWHVRDRVTDDYLPVAAARLVRALARALPAAVIANSTTTLASLHLPDARPRRLVVPDPLAPEFLTGAKASRSSPGPLRVGMVGRLAPWKGQHVFLDAFARAFPSSGAEAVVIGSALFGEGGYEHSLAELARDLGIESRVRFAGFREDVPRELARLDVLVHASLLPEPFGQVVTEGMAAGLAVVATDGGGPSELIASGVDGLLVPPGDPDALAAALQGLAADAELRRRLGDAARRRAEAFAPERMAPLVVELYRRILGAP